MASLSPKDIRHIAKLTRLQLREEEVEKFGKELSAILAYVEKLQEVNTKGVEPTAQVTGLNSVFRHDEIIASDSAPDALLNCSPLLIVDRQIQTPSAHSST